MAELLLYYSDRPNGPDLYAWMGESYWSACNLEAWKQRQLETSDAGNFIRDAALPNWLRAGWRVIPPYSPLSNHPCAECNRFVIANDYLCPACRTSYDG